MKQLYKKISLALLLFLVFTMVTPIASMAAELPVNLGTASSFSLLAGSTITNTGTTTIAGSVGLHPGTVFSGQGTATVSGEIHLADAVALQAKNDFLAAYNNADARAGNLIGAELGGSTITPGAYSADTALNITGTVTLDGQNDPNAVFIFQTGSTLITASSSNIVLINGANSSNIFWQVGTSATLGTNSQFKGNILAMESITATTGANIEGKLLTMTGAITLDNNTITNSVFVPVETTTEETTTTEPTTTEPTTTEPTTTEPTTTEGTPVTALPADPSYGLLTVNKVVTGNTGTMTLPAFVITVTGPENFSETRTFLSGEFYSWTNLVPGEYTVTESRVGLNMNWTVSGEGAVKVLANQSTAATITNQYANVGGIPQTGQTSNYGMALVLGLMAMVFATAGVIVTNKKKQYNA